MKVLHLFSNSRWTGPAEPALNLCVALRALGVTVDYACPPTAVGGRHTMLETARDRGIEPILGLRLRKHAHPVWNTLDVWALNRLTQRSTYDVIHCHLDNDHRIAIRSVGRAGIPVVRSSYYGAGLDRPSRHKRLLSHTAWIIEPGTAALEHDASVYGYPRDRMTIVPGAVDTARFDPARETPDGRRRLGIPAGAFVIGIVARMQTHRHYEDFFQAVRTLVDRHPNVHAVVVGRGTNQKTVGLEPVQALGIERHVHFPGYITAEDYVGMLKAFDVKVFLVPGSDGTCRAVREAMAMGKPAIVSRRGMLPEIVDDGGNGFVTSGSAAELTEALERLCGDRGLAHRLGRAAREKAVKEFSLEAQARAVLSVYEQLATRT